MMRPLSVEDTQAFDGFEVGSAPMTQIGASTDERVAAFHDAEDVERVPNLVIRPVHRAAVFMEGDPHPRPDGSGFPCDDELGGFTANRVKPHVFGEIQHAVHVFGIARPDDAVAHGVDALAHALGLEFGHRGWRHGVANLVGGTGFERLPRVEFDDVAAGFLGLGDGLKGAELPEVAGASRSRPWLARPAAAATEARRKGDHYLSVTLNTMPKRQIAKLKELGEEMKFRRHQSIKEQGAWLGTVLRGCYGYYAVPGNSKALANFRWELSRRWYRSLCRRSHRKRLNWSKMQLHISRWLPSPRIIHPYPEERFKTRHHSR